MDAMSASSDIVITKEKIWQYYEKLSDFLVKCRFCRKEYCYITIEYFKSHVKKVHKEIFEYEEEYLEKLPWRFFKCVDKGSSLQCVICSLTFEFNYELLSNHLRQHSMKQLEDHTFRSWAYKYCTRTEDFKVKCKSCNRNVDLYIKNTLNCHVKREHSEIILRNEQKAHETPRSSDGVFSFKSDTMCIPFNNRIVTKEKVWQYYEKLSDFLVKCKFCEKEYSYICVAHFKMHVKNLHKEIFEYEERQLEQLPWRFFKYFNEGSLQCIICSLSFESDYELLSNHLCQHSMKQLEDHTFRSWAWKYCTRTGNFEVECNSCNKNSIISIKGTLDYHIRREHSDILRNEQKIYETSQSSECVSSLETVAMSMPSNIGNKKLSLETETSVQSIVGGTIAVESSSWLWQYYTELPNFRVQCKACTYNHYYIDISLFKNHIDTQHKPISLFEETAFKNLEWQYFQILNNNFVKCVICDINLAIREGYILNDHISKHSEEDQQKWSTIPWPLKYFKKNYDLVAKCKICDKIINLYISLTAHCHILNKHSKFSTRI
nr:PREDICTED: uncharacterized protein LOC105674289 [Linepithema humile]